MTSPLSSTLFEVFALTAILLSVKALFLGVATAAFRGKVKQFINPEDAIWLGGEHVAADGERVARLGRAQRNDLENLVLFAVSGALYAASGASPTIGVVYFGTFFVSRVLHTVAYLLGRPQLRRNAYTVGFVVILAICIHAAWLILGRHLP